MKIDLRDLGTGAIGVTVQLPRALYYKTISEQTGIEVKNDGDLISTLAEMSAVKLDYDKLRTALEDVRKGLGGDFPRHLQNVHADSYTMEREQGYLYPHDFPNHWVQQQYLPDELVGTKYYEFGPNKLEQASKAYWDAVKK